VPDLPNPSRLITLDSRLRMAPTDRPALEALLDDLRGRLSGATDAGTASAIQRRLGVGLVALGQFDEAVSTLEHVVASAPDPRAEVAARVNLGDAFRYADRMTPAEQQYRAARMLAGESVPDLVHFTLQHLGKHLVDAGQYDEARSCLRAALELREAIGDPALIESTRAALELCAAREAGAARG